ncbi:hypothetical protein AB9T88_02085 [Flavobacterium sp. LBUM151]
MRRIQLLAFLLVFNLCFSQFAIINDVDGYVNVRSSAKTTNNITDKLDNGFIVYYFEPKGNWANIDYKKNTKELNGYIYKNKIKFITDFKEIPLKANQIEKVILDDGLIKIEISETKFLKDKHKLFFFKGNSDQLHKIDDSIFLGTDGDIPKREYKSLEVEINNVKVQIPNDALKNLYNPTLYNSKANYDQINDILYIHSTNSDGAGGYEIIWVIEKKKYKARIEAYGF